MQKPLWHRRLSSDHPDWCCSDRAELRESVERFPPEPAGRNSQERRRDALPADFLFTSGCTAVDIPLCNGIGGERADVV
jgi:hypothetical protein